MMEIWEEVTRKMNDKYAPIRGTVITVPSGAKFMFMSNNDLGIPYFAKVGRNGKPCKTLYTVSGYNRKWLDSQLNA